MRLCFGMVDIYLTSVTNLIANHQTQHSRHSKRLKCLNFILKKLFIFECFFFLQQLMIIFMIFDAIMKQPKSSTGAQK